MTTKTQFRTWAKDHPNFMTPRIQRITQVSEFFIEFSEGESWADDKKTIYGITILETDAEKGFKVCADKFESLKGCFFSRTEANQQFLKAIMTVRKFCEDRNYTNEAVK